MPSPLTGSDELVHPAESIEPSVPPPDDQRPDPSAGEARARARARQIGGLAAWGIIAFKAIKGAGAAKLLLFGAALWSIALVRPLPFAIALVYAILVHETGHILAMKRRGIPTSGIWFIPFVGAVAVARQAFRSQAETYFVAIAGPVFGLLSIVPLLAAQILLARTSADAAALLAYASAAAFINLLNLLPIGTLDGGRIINSLAMSLSPLLGLVVVGGGILLCASLLALSGSWVLGVLLLLSIFELLRSRKSNLLPPMSRKAVAGGIALYIFLFVLFALLGLVFSAASKYLLEAPVATTAEIDPALSTLSDIGCGQEDRLRSEVSTEATEITFTNHSTVTLSLYWLNFQGRRAFYTTLAPGRSILQKTNAPNPWLVAVNFSGDCVGIVRAAPTPGTVVVRSTTR